MYVIISVSTKHDNVIKPVELVDNFEKRRHKIYIISFVTQNYISHPN